MLRLYLDIGGANGEKLVYGGFLFEEVEEFLVHGGGVKAGAAFYFSAGHFAKEEAGFVVPRFFVPVIIAVHFSVCYEREFYTCCA